MFPEKKNKATCNYTDNQVQYVWHTGFSLDFENIIIYRLRNLQHYVIIKYKSQILWNNTIFSYLSPYQFKKISKNQNDLNVIRPQILSVSF